ncbi:MAG: SUMF1/EgtB/PvdO family nonheme iron enzyme [Saprospiraceae bacterium]|nr:SUMF1/EgtB/PvdO family nonheme iron enzyme [Saprospiraceae bacterium]
MRIAIQRIRATLFFRHGIRKRWHVSIRAKKRKKRHNSRRLRFQNSPHRNHLLAIRAVLRRYRPQCAGFSPDWDVDGDNPVVKVNWYQAVEYANWLSVQSDLEPAYAIDTLVRDTVLTKMNMTNSNG